MTLQEIRETEKEFLTPDDIREVLGCSPYSINVQAKEDASKLGFPVMILGTRVKIPRLGFLHWISYGNAPVMIGARE